MQTYTYINVNVYHMMVCMCNAYICVCIFIYTHMVEHGLSTNAWFSVGTHALRQRIAGYPVFRQTHIGLDRFLIML